MDRSPPDAESALCLECGLCCNSGLFDYVELTADDRSALSDAGRAAPERIELPCGFWQRSCTVYACRPKACRDFRCELLRKMQTGEVALPEALDRVRTAIGLRDRFVAILPDSRQLIAAAQRWRDRKDEGHDPQRLQAMLDFIAFRRFVERHFLKPKRHWASESAPEINSP